MRLRSPAPVLAAIAAVWLFSAAETAAAATSQIGSVAEIAAGALPSPISSGGFGVQVSEGAGTYAVPPGYGTITAWSHSAGGTPGVLTFKVYRPTGALREFFVVGSDTQTVAAGGVQTFPVHIAVQPGDRIGLSSDAVELAYETFDLGDQIGFFGADLPPGTTRATDGDPFPEFKLDVAATVTDDPAGTPAPDPAGDPGAPAPPSSAPPPTVTQLTVTPPAFAAARTGPSTRSTPTRALGAQVRYRLDHVAKVRFSVQRVSTGRRDGSGTAARCVLATKSNRTAARCPRYASIAGGFSQNGRAAANSLYFTGRVGARALAHGSYRLIATPTTAAGVVGNTVSRPFRIVR